MVIFKTEIILCSVKDGVRTFDDFLRDGLMEYLDVNEENNALVCYFRITSKLLCCFTAIRDRQCLLLHNYLFHRLLYMRESLHQQQRTLK